jgi:hypothetical protein
VPARAAFDENLTHYKQQIPNLFWFNALMILKTVVTQALPADSGTPKAATVG